MLVLIVRTFEDVGFFMVDVVRVIYYFIDVFYWDELGLVFGEMFGEIRFVVMVWLLVLLSLR